MNRYFYLFFLVFFLPVIAFATSTTTSSTPPASQGKAPAAKAPVSYDESWLDDEEEEEEPARPNTRWGRFMTKMDKAALAMKALYHFKLKPWWEEKHGKEITIAAGTTLATLAAAYAAYRIYKKADPYLKIATTHQFATN